jgi:hypothetical protein
VPEGAAGPAGPAPEPPRAEAPEPECPFCGARDSEPVASFGLSLMTSLRHCRRCRSDFEVVKWT